MANGWYKLHRTLARHRALSIAALFLLMAGMGYVAMQIPLEEDIIKLIPVKEGHEDLRRVLRTVKFTDKVVVHIALQENGGEGDLTDYADRFLDSLHARCGPYVEAVQGQVDPADMANTMAYVQDHLPQFLDSADYRELARVINSDSLAVIGRNNFTTLISPAGMVAKDHLRQDPLGITFKGLAKLKAMGLDDGLTIHKGYLTTQDHRNLLLFITPELGSERTADNEAFVQQLRAITGGLNNAYNGRVAAEYFGSVPIAVANAERIKADVRNSMIIATVLFVLLLFFFFRRLSVTLILFVPPLFGGLVGLCVLYLLRDSVSAISLGIGSVVLGCSMDHSLHVLTHLRERGGLKEVYKEVAGPVLVCSLTTACPLLCLLFLPSQALQDLGLFCAVAVVAASICALVFIPLAYRGRTGLPPTRTVVDRVAAFPYHRSRWFVGGLALLVLISFFTYPMVSFDNDLAKMNYMPADQQRAQDHLDSISDLASQTVHVVAYAPDLSTALRVNEVVFDSLQELQHRGDIMGFSSVATVLHSDQDHAQHIAQWNNFWTPARKDTMEQALTASAKSLGLKPSMYQPFFDRLAQPFNDSVQDPLAKIGAVDPADFIAGKDSFWTVTSIVRTGNGELAPVAAHLAGIEQVITIDRQHALQTLLRDVRKDFNLLVLYSFLAVLGILVIYFRNGILVLVTALPIMVTWLLTVGIMGMAGLQFNIFNIIIATFIFGVGIDFSVLIMQGLLQELRTGDGHILTHKTSIVLSVITTLLGIGVLAFAQHPALRSIALGAIIGIIAAMLVAFTLQPWLFKIFIGGTDRRPVSLRMLLHAILSFTYFGLGGVFLSLCATVVIPLIPVSKKVKMRWFHRIIAAFKKSVLYSNPFVKKQVLNTAGETFAKPAIMVANHTSFLDILAMGMLHPKVVFLVNDWVHDSPIFGKVVRLAGGFPVSQGIENGLGHLREKVRQGYSIMVFPEGSRSINNGIRRFHKGAFLLAHQFQLDIVPVLIHGNSEVLPKGSFVIRDGRIDISILPRIAYGSPSFGTDMKDTTKRVSAMFKAEFLALRRNTEGPAYFHAQVLDEYRYRDPQRLHELKRLLKQEAAAYHELMVRIPQDAAVLHLSKRGGHLDLCLLLDGPHRKLLTFIDHKGDREVVKNGVIAHTHARFTVLERREEALLAEADVVLIEEGALTMEELETLRSRTPATLLMHR